MRYRVQRPSTTRSPATFPPSSPGRGAWIALGAGLALLLGACAESRKGVDRRLPSLAAIAPEDPPRLPPSATETGPRVRLALFRIYVPQGEVPEALWEAVEPDGLSESLRRRLRANGLRAGRLSKSRWEKTREALPRATRIRREAVMLADDPTALRTTARLGRAARLRLEPEGNVERVGGGRLQWLLAAQPDPGGARARLTPHWHRRHASLRPKLPQEQALEGHRFTGLSIGVTLSGREGLLVGPQAMPSAATRPAEEKETEQSKTKPAGELLGNLLLRGRRYGRPTTVLLMVRPLGG